MCANVCFSFMSDNKNKNVLLVMQFQFDFIFSDRFDIFHTVTCTFGFVRTFDPLEFSRSYALLASSLLH